MLVHGAIIPPRAALAAVAAVVTGVPEPPEVEHPNPHKGLLGRLGRHKDSALERMPGPSMLAHVTIDQLHFPITGFGNLTTEDAHRVADVIEEAAAGWTPPRVWFAGGTALDFPGDWSVWAKLDGDLDALGTMVRGVTETVEAVGLFVDRRAFRPMLSVATVTSATTGPYLQQVVDALDGFRGEPWMADVVLTKEAFVQEGVELVEFRRIQLG